MNILLIIVAFIAGIMIGRDYESKQWCEDMLNDFAETERLRNENAYLKTKLGIAYPWDETKEETNDTR